MDLSKREWQILNMRSRMSLVKIAEILGIRKESVLRIESRAKKNVCNAKIDLEEGSLERHLRVYRRVYR